MIGSGHLNGIELLYSSQKVGKVYCSLLFIVLSVCFFIVFPALIHAIYRQWKVIFNGFFEIHFACLVEVILILIVIYLFIFYLQKGAYRNDDGKPVVLDCVREAERRIAGNQFM